MGVRASAPLRRKRGSQPPSPAAEPPLELAIISDPGEDLDDELAMVYLRHLVALYPSLVVRCVVCNLRPARKRAALMRQTLDALNMKHVPVGVGDEVVPPSRARDDDEDWAFIDAGAYASVHADGQVLLLGLKARVADSSAHADGSSACRRRSRGSPAADCPSGHMLQWLST